MFKDRKEHYAKALRQKEFIVNSELRDQCGRGGAGVKSSLTK